MASSLPPEKTIAIAAQQGWKAIPTGIAHGTVTLVLPGRVVEVTTLRRDVETDGRHAVVAYTDDFAEDAARRDFTMNALSMDAEGSIYDYYRGREDIEAQLVRFIGDAGTRIAEDGLRILRFFRFVATHGLPPADPAAMAAITAQREMISQLSGERIAQEMRKLLSAPMPSYALGRMAQAGLAEFLTVGAWDGDGLLRLLELEKAHGIAPDPWLRLLAMIAPDARATTAEWVGERWKLSRAERDIVKTLAASILSPQRGEEEVKALLRHYPRPLVQSRVLLAAVDGGFDPAALLALTRDWAVPSFPVTAGDLLVLGYSQGKALGEALAELEQHWVESDYTLTRDELLVAL